VESNPVEITPEVIDDGIGFDPALERQLKGVGLVSMRERARDAGGELTLTAKPGHGTRVQARVPLAGQGNQPSVLKCSSESGSSAFQAISKEPLSTAAPGPVYVPAPGTVNGADHSPFANAMNQTAVSPGWPR
jgi:hypothetical protein